MDQQQKQLDQLQQRQRDRSITSEIPIKQTTTTQDASRSPGSLSTSQQSSSLKSINIPQDIQDRYKKLDEVLSKRPLSSSASVSRFSPASALKNQLIGQSIEKLKQTGNQDLLKDLEERDKKLQLFMAKAGSIGSSDDQKSSSYTSLRLSSGKQSQQQQPQQASPQLNNSQPISKLSQSLKSNQSLKISIDLPPEVRRRLNATLGQSPKSAVLPKTLTKGSSLKQDVQDQKSPEVQSAVDDLPLNDIWQIMYDRRGYNAKPSAHGIQDYESVLVQIGQFSTIQQFWRYFNHLKPPSQLEQISNFHIFRKGIKPMWEDPANKNGGKWNIIFNQTNGHLADESWTRCLCAMIGETIDDSGEICGAVFSKRSKGDRLALWIRNKDSADQVLDIGAKFLISLKLDKLPIDLEFLPHSKVLSSTKSRSSINGSLPGSSQFGISKVNERIREIHQKQQ